MIIYIFQMTKLKQLIGLVLFMYVILYTSIAIAQDDSETDRLFFGGVIAGTNFSQVDGDNFAGYHKVGLNMGAVLYLNIAKPFALSMELLFAQKGSKAGVQQIPKRANDNITIITDYSIKLNYAEIPILINYIDQKKNIFGFGLSIGYLGSSKENYRDGNDNVFENDAKIFPFLKKDINGIAHAGFALIKHLNISLRAQYSFFSIRNNGNFITGRNQQFNNLFAIRLSYLF